MILRFAPPTYYTAVLPSKVLGLSPFFCSTLLVTVASRSVSVSLACFRKEELSNFPLALAPSSSPATAHAVLTALQRSPARFFVKFLNVAPGANVKGGRRRRGDFSPVSFVTHRALLHLVPPPSLFPPPTLAGCELAAFAILLNLNSIPCFVSLFSPHPAQRHLNGPWN